MKREIGADGDFAFAYVIAHEVGHHVQNLLGILGDAHNQMARMSEKESNRMSVRLELQADYFAGVWAHHDNLMFGSLEAGDGTSAQRSKWLKKGISTGDINQGDTFSINYDSL